MDTLVSLGSSVAFWYPVVAVFALPGERIPADGVVLEGAGSVGRLSPVSMDSCRRRWSTRG